MARYIDADIAIEKMKIWHTQERLIACVKNTPTANVQEVRHAKFELIDNGKGICSNCHRLDSIDNLAKYCRYCGAKMDGR